MRQNPLDKRPNQGFGQKFRFDNIKELTLEEPEGQDESSADSLDEDQAAFPGLGAANANNMQSQTPASLSGNRFKVGVPIKSARN